MSISDAEFQAWLMGDNPRCFLVEMEAYDATVATTWYFSNLEYNTGPTESPPNTRYSARVVDIPAFKSGMDTVIGVGNLVLDISDGVMAGSAGSVGSLYNLINPSGALTYAIDGRAVRIYIGDPAWARADFRPYLIGMVDDVAAADLGSATIALRDAREKLNRPIQTHLVDTGPEAGNPVPLAFGWVLNAEPVLIDPANLVYQFHDGAVSSFSTVRDNGLNVSFAGSASAGTVQLAAAPVGRITGDLQASSTPGLGGLLAALFAHAGLSSSDWDAANFADFDADHYGSGFHAYIRDRQNLSQYAADLAAEIGAYCHPGRDGVFRLWQLAAPGASAVVEFYPHHFEKNGLTLVRKLPAVETVRVGAYINSTIQDGDGLAGALTADERAKWAIQYWDIRSHTNGGITTAHPNAINPGLVGTHLISGANLEAERRGAMGDRCRSIWQAALIMPMCPCALGDDVYVEYPGLGFTAGKYAKVVAIDERPMAGRTILELIT